MDRNWNKISAVFTIIGVFLTSLIGVGGLVLMWWIYQHPIISTEPTIGATEVRSMLIAWWMPVLIVLAIISAGLLHLKAAAIASRATTKPTPIHIPALPDTPLARATRETFESLSVSQRLLVRHIYHHPNTQTAFLLPVLSEMGFPTRIAGDSLNKVLTTNLVSQDTRHTFSNPEVKEIVERLIDRDNLPSLETIKNITSETTSALRIDCNLGCDRRVEVINTRHLDVLIAARQEVAISGALSILAYEASELAERLTQIIQEDHADPEPKKWRCPLDRKITTTATGEPWSWQRRSWAQWQQSFWAHRLAVVKFHPRASEAEVITKIGAEGDATDTIENAAILEILVRHRRSLYAEVAAILKRYEDFGKDGAA